MAWGQPRHQPLLRARGLGHHAALAFGLACKEIHVGGYRGWRLRVLEAFIIIPAFTQLLYVMALHAGLFGNQFGDGYGAEHQYGDHHHKGMGTGAPAARV